MKSGAGKLDGILIGIGRKPGDDEEDASPKDMAAKALWKAIQKEDFEGFKSALGDYVSYCAEKGEDTEEGE